MRVFEIPTGNRPPHRCKILCGARVLERLPGDLGGGVAGSAVLLSDDRVAPLYGQPLLGALEERGIASRLFSFPAGEASKTREVKAELEDRIAAAGLGRDGVILGIGGGVTCDLAGFIAATWHRGIRLILVPTSLLAMVDASIGGKTAVDLPGAKNQVGAFHFPTEVYVDPSCLTTLPEPFFVQGMAEVVKYAVIADRGLFETLEGLTNGIRDLRSDGRLLEEMIERCVDLKAQVVAKDPLDRGTRAMLNFGHTAGHGIEAAAGYRISHGEAVAIGMVAEARMADRFPARERDRLKALLEKLGLPVSLSPGIDPGEVVRAARADKKQRGGQFCCALPDRIGRMPLERGPVTVVPETEFRIAFRND